MQRFTLIGLAAFTFCTVAQLSSASAAKPLSCGYADSLLVHMDAGWPARKGMALVEGPIIADFLGEAAPVSIPCARQGGSSMKPWWVCEMNRTGKSIEVVMGLDPAVEVTFLENGDIVQEHTLTCAVP